MLRVTRVVNAVAAGRILNPKTAGSQIMGAVVGGIGMALHEEAVIDHHYGRIINHNFAEYHVPVNADVHDIEVIFVDEREAHLNPLGIKGVGEIGIVGMAAAIANAVYHATGRARPRPPDHHRQDSWPSERHSPLTPGTRSTPDWTGVESAEKRLISWLRARPHQAGGDRQIP